MANLDRLLGKLLNVYGILEEDCIGGYSDFRLVIKMWYNT